MVTHRITLSQYRALAEIRHRVRLFLAFSEARSRAIGIETGQHQLLLAVRGLPRGMEPTIGTIAERLGVQHHSAVELAARAERAGVVTRRRGKVDQRTVTLAITPRGHRILEKLSEEHRAELASTAPALVRALRAIVKGKTP